MPENTPPPAYPSIHAPTAYPFLKLQLPASQQSTDFSGERSSERPSLLLFERHVGIEEAQPSLLFRVLSGSVRAVRAFRQTTRG